jgi:hypothetical protein
MGLGVHGECVTCTSAYIPDIDPRTGFVVSIINLHSAPWTPEMIPNLVAEAHHLTQ